MVVVVVGIARVVMQRADRAWRDPLLEFFHVQLDLVVHTCLMLGVFAGMNSWDE
jgi:hypothetical protein